MKKTNYNDKAQENNKDYQRFIKLKSKYSSPIFLTAEKAADYLGIKLSTLYKKTHFRELPYYKPTGKKIYFLLSDLNDFISRKRYMSKYEMDEDADFYVSENGW